jgi:hypothetical protein
MFGSSLKAKCVCGFCYSALMILDFDYAFAY